MQTMKTRVVFNRGTFELNTVTNSVLGLEADKGLKPKECKNYVLGTNNEWYGYKSPSSCLILLHSSPLVAFKAITTHSAPSVPPQAL